MIWHHFDNCIAGTSGCFPPKNLPASVAGGPHWFTCHHTQGTSVFSISWVLWPWVIATFHRLAAGVLGGGQNKPTTAPAEERCDSGRQAAAVLSAKMAAHSAYRHRAQLRGGGLPLPTICLKCGSSLGRLNSLCVELIKEMPSPLLATG